MKRKIGLVILVLILVFTLAPAIVAQAETNINTFSVNVSTEVNTYKKAIRQGKKLQLVVEDQGRQVRAARVEFSSSKKSVVYVNDQGVLTARKPGSAVISVKFKQKKALITIKVPEGSDDPEPAYSKTIKNYLLGALTPVGKVLYIWGGGWYDAARKGLSPTMTKWFKRQSPDYDFQDYDDLSYASRAKGFDCSGYVGWSTYQVLHKTSNECGGYTVVSGQIGSAYQSWGLGFKFGQNRLASKNYVLKPGDVGYKDGHCFIVLGQCSDKSIVIMQSTPQAGVQISGTATPYGKANSEAAALAKKYMKRYYPASVAKYPYRYYTGNFIPEYKYLRWYKDVLKDPDGYKKMSADAILKDLFASAS